MKNQNPDSGESFGLPKVRPRLLAFDIETGPADGIESLIPPFDPSEVKVGNMKDPALIAAKVAAAEASHRANFISNAALAPESGKVLAIGCAYIGEDGKALDFVALVGDEAEILRSFWGEVRRSFLGQSERTLFVGFNSREFDLPFLVARSFVLGVPVPPVYQMRGRYPNWSSAFIDLRDLWTLGRNSGRSNLDTVARALVGRGKSGSGATFADDLASNPEQAIAYLRTDLELTCAVAARMGFGSGLLPISAVLE
jgi:hypothetical protein